MFCKFPRCRPLHVAHCVSLCCLMYLLYCSMCASLVMCGVSELCIIFFSILQVSTQLYKCHTLHSLTLQTKQNGICIPGNKSLWTAVAARRSACKSQCVWLAQSPARSASQRSCCCCDEFGSWPPRGRAAVLAPRLLFCQQHLLGLITGLDQPPIGLQELAWISQQGLSFHTCERVV